MKKLFGTLVFVCLLVCAMTVSASAMTQQEMLDVVIPDIIRHPDTHYVPSNNVEDYHFAEDGFAVMCGDIVVGNLIELNGNLYYESEEIPTAPFINVYDEDMLNVTPLKQTGKNDCWAACCAMIIRYCNPAYSTVSVQDVLNKVGKTNLKPQPWSVMKAAYNKFDLYPEETEGAATLAQISSWISNNKPLHAGCVQTDAETGVEVDGAHSLVIVGWSVGEMDSVKYIDPYSGKRKDAYFYSYTQWDKTFACNNGERFYICKWNYTRYGF